MIITFLAMRYWYPLKPLTATALALGLASLVGCASPETRETETDQSSTSNSDSELINVVVSITPQKYFVEQVGGELVNVSVLVPPGSSPGTYEPKPQQIQNLSNTKMFVRIRVPFENAWWERMTSANPDMKIVDLTEGIDRIPRGAKQGNEEDTQESAETPANPDPHIWLSPRLVKKQAQTIYNGLVEIDPQNKETYQENLAEFHAEIERLDEEIEQTLAGLQNRNFMVFHPAWGYFAADYNLEMVPIEVGGNEPSAAEMSRLISKAEQEQIRVVFAQPQFSTQSAETIANQINGEVILINPLAEDWSDNLRRVASTFQQVLED